MKKVVVMSDSHGYHKMIDEVQRLEPDGDYYVHCGDSEAREEQLKGWICVRGIRPKYRQQTNQAARLGKKRYFTMESLILAQDER